jgi:hypothetical protein
MGGGAFASFDGFCGSVPRVQNSNGNIEELHSRILQAIENGG